jgi:hypothetical protein
MKIAVRSLESLALAFMVSLPCRSQVAAPASLPACLIQYLSMESLTSSHGGSVVLYNSDQTYIEISSSWQGPIGGGTAATVSGRYTYSVDPQNASHATITYQPPRSFGASSDELYFYAQNSGSELAAQSMDFSGKITLFNVYPRQLNNGGVNHSCRCQLEPGGFAISGFVIESDGPRWVLIRAVGASLKNFGVPSAVSNPSFSLSSSSQGLLGSSADWSSDPNLVNGYDTIFSVVGAFQLNIGSDEGVLLLPLDPGAYTAVFQAGSAGTILCEVYILPFGSFGQLEPAINPQI